MLHALDAVTLRPRARTTLRGEAVRVVVQADGRLIVSNTADKSLTRHSPPPWPRKRGCRCPPPRRG
ncbi:hypothetical protein GCM10020258_14460 [Sphingomonas yabuuchiae]